jgi:hypothetical protein
MRWRWLNVELFSFMGPLVVLAYTIGAGAWGMDIIAAAAAG